MAIDSEIVEFIFFTKNVAEDFRLTNGRNIAWPRPRNYRLSRRVLSGALSSVKLSSRLMANTIRLEPPRLFKTDT